MQGPQWLQALLVERLGCPSVCGAPRAVSRGWLDACSCKSLEHNVYRCRRSRRRISYTLPSGQAVAAGLTPAQFQEIWRQHGAEHCWLRGADATGPAALVQAGPVLCPHFGCQHVAPDSAAALRHAASCPVAAAAAREGTGGFSYAASELVLAAYVRRASRGGRSAHVNMLLDMSFGGDRWQEPVDCACEVDLETRRLLLRQATCASGGSNGAVRRLQLDHRTEVHRGWRLDQAQRLDLQRGAFPRKVTSVNFGPLCYEWQDSWSADNDNCISVRGHALAFPDKLVLECFHFEACHGLLSDEQWARTAVVALSAASGSPKQKLRCEFLQRSEQGVFDTVEVYIPNFMDQRFPAQDHGWRQSLERCWLESKNSVSEERKPRIEKRIEACLAREAPSIATREAIKAEYRHSQTDFVFIVFDSRSDTERIANLLDSAARGST